MRIELPSPSWADAHRAQDDAHTLTLPEQRPLTLADRLFATADEGETVRAEIRPQQHPTVTLTF